MYYEESFDEHDRIYKAMEYEFKELKKLIQSLDSEDVSEFEDKEERAFFSGQMDVIDRVCEIFCDFV